MSDRPPSIHTSKNASELEFEPACIASWQAPPPLPPAVRVRSEGAAPRELTSSAHHLAETTHSKEQHGCTRSHPASRLELFH